MSALALAFSLHASASQYWAMGRLPGDLLDDYRQWPDLVCAGTFEGDSQAYDKPVQWKQPVRGISIPGPRTATFRIDHVIHGDQGLEGRGVEVLYVASLPPSPGVRLHAGDREFPDLAHKLGKRRCLLQLWSHEDGTWEIRFAGDSYMALGAKPDAADWAGISKWQRLEQEFASAVLDPDPQVAALAIASSSSQPSPAEGPVLIAALRKRAADEDLLIRRLAICGLVRFGDLDTIYELKQTLPQLFAQPVTAGFQDPAASLNIAAITTRNAVPALVELSLDPQPLVRWGATNALRNIGGKDTKAALADRLADMDPQVRYQAAMGLGNGLEPRDVGAKDWKGWLPAANIYDKDPDKVLNNWKNWWTQKGKAQYPTVDSVLAKAQRFRTERPWANAGQAAD